MNFLKNFVNPNLNNFSRTVRRSYVSHPGYKHLLEKFNATYPYMMKQVLKVMEPDPVRVIVEQMFTHQFRRGRQLRPAMVLKIHEAMTSGSPSDIGSGGYQQIHGIAWIIELIQTTAIFVDDLVDSSQLRRGETPWYKFRGKFAPADLGVTCVSPFIVLNEWLHDDVFYHTASKLTVKHALSVITQQILEQETYKWIDEDNVTWDKYYLCCKMRGWYCSEITFKLAACEATKQDLKFDDLTDKILDEIAILLQLQNDASNVIPNPDNFDIGKDLDEDIKDKKLCFPLVYLLHEASTADRSFILENIGKRSDDKFVKEMRAIYKKYDLPEATKAYLRNFNNSIAEKIEKVSNEHKIRDGLKAAHETMMLYHKMQPSKENIYPK